MGDTSRVLIEIRESDYNRLLQIEFGGDPERMKEELYCSEISESTKKGIVEFCAEECNEGEWDELEDLLKRYFIEFDKEWARGNYYSSGRSHFRLIKGKLRGVSIHESIEIFLDFLQKVKDMDSEEIKARVQEEYEGIIPFEIQPL